MALEDLRILRLEAENVKKLKVVDITPKGELVVVAGKNRQGKTSVLDSILWALAGKSEIQWKPIREGEAKARIVLDLGNDEGLQLQVTRTFTAQPDGDYTTALKVRTPEGFKPDGEQTLLTALIGALSFDPGAFIRAKPDDQVKLLKSVVPGDFAAIAARRKAHYERRTEFNREADRIEKVIKSSAAFPADLPKKPIDTKALVSQLTAIGDQVRALSEAEAGRDRLRNQADVFFRERDRLRALAEDLRNQAAEADAEADQENARGMDLEAELRTLVLPPAPADSEELREKIDAANATNRIIEKREEYDALVELFGTLKTQAEEATAEIEKADADAVAMIEKADLPVRGLSIENDAVYLRGVPFNQASDAEQLRAAMALGMAANPRLRVIRIRDGSLLDTDALQVIREVAHEARFQIWLERVGSLGDGEEIIMEDGEVKNG